MLRDGIQRQSISVSLGTHFGAYAFSLAQDRGCGPAKSERTCCLLDLHFIVLAQVIIRILKVPTVRAILSVKGCAGHSIPVVTRVQFIYSSCKVE